jgi:hypothetical protein
MFLLQVYITVGVVLYLTMDMFHDNGLRGGLGNVVAGGCDLNWPQLNSLDAFPSMDVDVCTQMYPRAGRARAKGPIGVLGTTLG